MYFDRYDCQIWQKNRVFIIWQLSEVSKLWKIILLQSGSSRRYLFMYFDRFKCHYYCNWTYLFWYTYFDRCTLLSLEPQLLACFVDFRRWWCIFCEFRKILKWLTLTIQTLIYEETVKMYEIRLHFTHKSKNKEKFTKGTSPIVFNLFKSDLCRYSRWE